MIGCKEFVESEKIRHKSFQTCLEDQPLIVQFCGRDPESLLAAATLVQHHCQAVDINLGIHLNLFVLTFLWNPFVFWSLFLCYTLQ
jgi:hypothetical protein